MENLIKLHKAQLASDRMSCSATANQVRLVLHTAAFWLMHGVRAAIPKASPLAKCEFATIRERLIKIGARVIEHLARIRVQLPTSCPDAALFRCVALGFMPSGAIDRGAVRPDKPPTWQINPEVDAGEFYNGLLCLHRPWNPRVHGLDDVTDAAFDQGIRCVNLLKTRLAALEGPQAQSCSASKRP